MKTFIVSCPQIANELKIEVQKELLRNYGLPTFVEVLPKTWLLRAETNANSIHQCLEDFLTNKINFIIYELADELDFFQNVRPSAIDWTDENF